ncbi:fructosamine kinase [Acrodontium crateriforme]|uniref:protein-ribulosamine 3-kinase n=1 Tax=Acrodontium crateriforme TaxID=150365 RepID=A0AAQ3M5W7_9PEZI|nr:fructosamine kinase [Acrodontium crateriforme]
MTLDSKLVTLLDIDPHEVIIHKYGSSGFATTWRITTKLPSGEEAQVMFQGEHESLKVLRQCLPTLCPKSYGYGKLDDSSTRYFILTDFFDKSAQSSKEKDVYLVQKLAKLHTAPAPIPDGYTKRPFGFPCTTCCVETPQNNTCSSSWADFYANSRPRFIMKQSEKKNGPDTELSSMVETLCSNVVHGLLGDSHLNSGNAITPVLIHGNLWGGNTTWGKLPGMEVMEQIVFDSSACYAHSEFELGIMKMFGGFGREFMDEYHALVSKTEPVDEFDDRLALYELYHHLNHHAMFGGGYRSGAVSIMRMLIGKYSDS